MLRFTRMALGLVLILSMTGREAQAQWGYGGWGYGGWGVGTPQSLGCVELPLAASAEIWPYTPIGTLVTIET